MISTVQILMGAGMLKSVAELVAESAGRVARISMEQAHTMKDAVIVDVREPGEVAAQPFAGSVNIPRGLLEMKITELTQEPSTPICVYCATGTRAILAGDQLLRLGFTNISAIDPGAS